MLENLYTNLSEKEWEKTIKSFMPKGFLWNNIGKKGTVIDTFLNCIAKIMAEDDYNFTKKLNGLHLSPESEFLDEYWDMFDISKYIKEKPKDKKIQYKIINAFAKASAGLSTSQQIEDFINDIFDLKINIYISDIKTNEYNNYFPCKFPFYLQSFDMDDNTVIVELPSYASSDDDNVFPTKQIPFTFINEEDFSEAIKMLLDLIIDADLKIIYI